VRTALILAHLPAGGPARAERDGRRASAGAQAAGSGSVQPWPASRTRRDGPDGLGAAHKLAQNGPGPRSAGVTIGGCPLQDATTGERVEPAGEVSWTRAS
jgi:hypothetical protein